MNLVAIEQHFIESVDISKIKDDLVKLFNELINNIENIEILNEINSLAKGEPLVFTFESIKLHLLNQHTRAPYLWARLDISTEASNKPFAWYDLEYGVNGEVLDDYIDFY